MELPKGIEKEILEYLHLEYGASLKLEDIVNEKMYEVAGIPTHYWRDAPVSDVSAYGTDLTLV